MSVFCSDCKYMFFGDSHIYYNFKGISDSVIVNYSKTMYSVGEDGIIPGLDNKYIKDKVVILSYGEIDVRHRIHDEVKRGKDILDIIDSLVCNYMNVINKLKCKEIVVCGILYQHDKGYMAVGSYYERTMYRNILTTVLRNKVIEGGYIFFDIPGIYFDRFSELTDGIHIRDNIVCIEEIKKILDNIV